MRPKRKDSFSSSASLFLAVASGILLGLAFPPFGYHGLVWIGLVPLLRATYRSKTCGGAFLCGLLAGLICFLIAAKPLASAYLWSGWASGSPADIGEQASRQWWFLHGLWVAIALWIGVFWGLFAASLKWLGGQPTWRRFLVAPALWILLPEWLRSLSTWGFQWGFLGYATADLPWIRQSASLGGVWLPSALVVLANLALYQLLFERQTHKYYLAPVGVGALLACCTVFAEIKISRLHDDRGIRVAALQHHKDKYQRSDFLAFGLDRSYWTLLEQALERGFDLLVLPESIAYGSVSLDGSLSASKPRELQSLIDSWTKSLQPLLAGKATVLALGLDTVEDAKPYNSTLVWESSGVAGWYHKQKLVPFGEYSPRLWGALASQGQSQYNRGHPAVIHAGKLILGPLICQEIQFPSVVREAVRAGANVLISGGNDGVFGHPAVAEIHADMAQIRSIEAGRYMVRAMKTGISAIIDPTGREMRRSLGAESLLLWSQIRLLEGQTIYARLGDWPVWASLAVLAVATLRMR